MLVEKNNIGSATSSWSTKLIHGGLRYLENFEFKLVRESLKEREIIKRIAQDIQDHCHLLYLIKSHKDLNGYSNWFIFV